MSDDMVERVARAICEHGICQATSDEDDVRESVEASWRAHTDLARAVIAALPQDHPNLGFNLSSPIMPAWGMTVTDHEGRALTIAFSYDQAREIARRITAHFASLPLTRRRIEKAPNVE